MGSLKDSVITLMSDQIKDIELPVKGKIDCDDGQDNAVAALV